MNVMTVHEFNAAEIDGLDQAFADALKADFASCDLLAAAEEAYSEAKDNDGLKVAFEIAAKRNVEACKRVNEISMTIANRRWHDPRGMWLKALALAFYGGDYGSHSAGPYERGATYHPGGGTLDVDSSLIKSMARDAQDFSGLMSAAAILAESNPEPPTPPLPPAEEAALIVTLDCELAASYIRFAQENADAERLEGKWRDSLENGSEAEIEHAKSIAEIAESCTRTAAGAHDKIEAKINAAGLTSSRGNALRYIATVAPYLRKLGGTLKSVFGSMDCDQTLAAQLAESFIYLHPDLAISRLILSGDERTWADDKGEPTDRIEHVLFGTDAIAAAARRKFKGADAELLRLAATLEAIQNLRLRFDAVSREIDCPFYEASWQYREKINAIPARTVAGLAAKKMAAEVALWGDDDRSNSGPGSYRDLADSILDDINAIASAKSEHRSAA